MKEKYHKIFDALIVTIFVMYPFISLFVASKIIERKLDALLLTHVIYYEE